MRKAASVKSSPIEGMILDKRSSNAAPVIQGRYRQRPGDGSQRPAVAPSQGFPFRKGVSSPEPRPQRSAHGAHAAHAAPAAAGSGAALQDSEAACLIQRFVRRRKSERLQGRWLQIIELRKQFIDAEVVNPGELYDDDMLLAREALKSDPKLKAAIETAWHACSQGSVLLSREGYFTMMRKLYLCLTLDDGQQPDSYECLRFMQRDWARDAGGRAHLTRSEFEEAWFQLADLYTTQVDADLYADWVLTKVHKIAHPRFREAGWDWRSDAVMMDEVSYSGDIGEMQRRCRGWDWRSDAVMMDEAS